MRCRAKNTASCHKRTVCHPLHRSASLHWRASARRLRYESKRQLPCFLCHASTDREAATASRLASSWRRAAVSAWHKVSTGPSSGYPALFGVAILWGSYTPALRFLFLSDEPPSAAMMNALQACLPIPFLAASGIASIITQKKPRPIASRASLTSMSSLASYDDLYDPTMYTPSMSGSSTDQPAPAPTISRPLNNAFERASAYALNWCSGSLVVAGAELGLWLFLDYSLEVLGVQHVSATKAAFLNQATVLITPVLVYLSGKSVAWLDWVACSVALVGSVLVAADSFFAAGVADMASDMASGTASATAAVQAAPIDNEVLGYGYVLLSAVFFAMSTVRMGRYSTRFSSLDLASASTACLAVLSLGWLALSAQETPDGVVTSINMLYKLFDDPTRLAVLLWVGIGPGALAAVLQASGQQQVAPAQAQVIYATTPIFATGLAMVFLHAADEAMGLMAWSGAALMLAASVIASVGVTEHEAA